MSTSERIRLAAFAVLEQLSLSLRLPIALAEWDVMVNIEMENIKVIIAQSHVPSLEISTAIAKDCKRAEMIFQSRYEFMREDKLRHHIKTSQRDAIKKRDSPLKSKIISHELLEH